MEIPRNENGGGWTVDPVFLSRIKRVTKEIGEFATGEEEIEQIILALASLGFLTISPRKQSETEAMLKWFVEEADECPRVIYEECPFGEDREDGCRHDGKQKFPECWLEFARQKSR